MRYATFFFFYTFFGHESRRGFVLTLSKTFYILTIRDKYYVYTSGENVMFLDTSYISLGMTKASSKRQQVALEYVQQAAARRTRFRAASGAQ